MCVENFQAKNPTHAIFRIPPPPPFPPQKQTRIQQVFTSTSPTNTLLCEGFASVFGLLAQQRNHTLHASPFTILLRTFIYVYAELYIQYTAGFFDNIRCVFYSRQLWRTFYYISVNYKTSLSIHIMVQWSFYASNSKLSNALTSQMVSKPS